MKLVSFIFSVSIFRITAGSPISKLSFIYWFMFMVKSNENWPFPESVIDFGFTSIIGVTYSYSPIIYAMTEIVMG